ncbi:YjcG family protein [Texcoconibacillus texcoconensis]|uniref:Putative phosphoesterase HNQ41_000408 n=1 Tax=Texcoconibacillus texcoconensis TaxID=1095777 RepID=A0A840QLM8_9BACI|nr:YjcG family protein [Texcoconibacillus texcoconensis]MBB5172268.1 2'-5' RNA ligase [Texcoconibacillus texcoconensis]
MNYRVSIFPSKKLQDIANAYRKRYDSHYSLIPPHITLKEPFAAGDFEMESMVKKIRELAKQTKPFPLEVYKFSSFHPVTNTIYMKVREHETLMSLHERLNEGELGRHVTYQFVPHITIGQDLKDAECSDVLGRLKMETIDHEEMVDRFSLLYQLENGSWTVYETFLLGKE